MGLKTGVSILESLELSDVVDVVSSNNDGSSHLGLDNLFALFWFLNRDFYKVQMENPRGWILEFILRTPTSRSESKTSSKSRTRRSRRRRMWDHDLFLVLVILSPNQALKLHIGFNAEILFIFGFFAFIEILWRHDLIVAITTFVSFKLIFRNRNCKCASSH